MNYFGHQDEINLYQEAFADSWGEGDPAGQIRFVVLDTETTGLDPRKDAIVTIGAVAIENGEICLDDQFEALLQISHNTSSVVVHGITRDAAEKYGVSEVEGLRAFLGYLRDGVIVGHHIGFDVDILSARCQQRFGFALQNRWIDTMELTLHLEDAGAFGAPDRTERPSNFSLDGLCERFGIAPHDRHTAAGDAFITAQIFLKLLRKARQYGRRTLGTLSERYPHAVG